MRPLRHPWLLAVLACLLPGSLLAAQTAYVTAWNQLYRLDLETAQAKPVGPGLGFNDVEGLALSPDGVLYGIADGTRGQGSEQTDFLLRIDPETGIATQIAWLSALAGQGPHGELDYGLTFTCDGRLWASSDTTGLLWEINPANGSVRKVGNTDAPISGLTARGNELYGIGVQNGFGDPAQQALYRIDPETAEAVRVGSLEVSDTLSSSGADFDADGTLWATLDSQPPDVDRPSRLARIHLQSGRAQAQKPIQGILENISVRAMAISPPGGCATSPDDGNAIVASGPTLVPVDSIGLLTGLSLLLAGFGWRRLSGTC